jgi:hypothetical protein
MIIGDVPCSGCTRCCKGDAIRLLPGDAVETYQTVPHPYFTVSLMLDHKPNGDCIYLDDKGCTIHERRPRQCREMDCRLLATKITFTQVRKMSARNQLKLPVWQKGKELLKNDTLTL